MVVAARQKQTRIFERVQEAIMDDIQHARVKPGDRLPSERALAEKFGVSRHAVREALRTLEMSGVLRFAKGVSGGAFVRKNSSDGVSQSIRNMILLGRMPLSDLAVVRISLLVLAVELAAERATEEDFADLDANIDETQAAILKNDSCATITPVLEFVSLLGRASHNLVLDMLLESIVEIMREVLFAYQLPTEIDIISPRRDVVRALRDRDIIRAVEGIRSHYEQVTEYVLKKVSLDGWTLED